MHPVDCRYCNAQLEYDPSDPKHGHLADCKSEMLTALLIQCPDCRHWFFVPKEAENPTCLARTGSS